MARTEPYREVFTGVRRTRLRAAGRNRLDAGQQLFYTEKGAVWSLGKNGILLQVFPRFSNANKYFPLSARFIPDSNTTARGVTGEIDARGARISSPPTPYKTH
jgi:hypothetical protein